HRAPHAFNLSDVRLQRPVVKAQLHCAPSFGEASRGVVGALLARANLDTTGIAADSVAVPAPQTVQRLARGLSNNVPQRDLHAPAPASIAEDAGVLLQRKRVSAQQARLDPALESGR